MSSLAGTSLPTRSLRRFNILLTRKVSSNCDNVVFILWGKNAHDKRPLIDSKKHLILKSVHPSPLSAHRGFFGCKHFSKANAYLKENGKDEIEWKL
jgi:uracil-DNA glycosylase